jgi:hypothetical protein
VAEVRAALLEALQQHLAVSLDLTGASAADAAFVQLLGSARSSFEAQSVCMEVEDPAGVLRSAFSGN